MLQTKNYELYKIKQIRLLLTRWNHKCLGFEIQSAVITTAETEKVINWVWGFRIWLIYTIITYIGNETIDFISLWLLRNIRLKHSWGKSCIVQTWFKLLSGLFKITREHLNSCLQYRSTALHKTGYGSNPNTVLY